MKRSVYFVSALVVALISLPLASFCAQTPAKTSRPQVPITYPSDTHETIARRAQWIEGARKEGTLSQVERAVGDGSGIYGLGGVGPV